jgi:ATP adenylyltransferase
LAKKKKVGKGKQKSSSVLKKAKSATSAWPAGERNIFYRPNRLKYVRKMIKEDGCVFCRSAEKKQSVETLCVYKSAHSQIVLNKYPYNNGHLLVLPLVHCGNLLDLSNDQYDDLQATLRIAIEAVQKVYQPHGFNIGMNHGATGGAGIPDHLHYHIIPRWNGDLNFLPLVADVKLVIETVDTTYQKYADYFQMRSL